MYDVLKRQFDNRVQKKQNIPEILKTLNIERKQSISWVFNIRSLFKFNHICNTDHFNGSIIIIIIITSLLLL